MPEHTIKTKLSTASYCTTITTTTTTTTTTLSISQVQIAGFFVSVMPIVAREDMRRNEGVRATEAPTAMDDAVGYCCPTSTNHHPPIINNSRAPGPRATGTPNTTSTGAPRRVIGTSGPCHPQNQPEPHKNNKHNDRSDDEEPPARRRRIDVSPCCTCSRNSTCQQAPTANKQGCECKVAGRRCILCVCLRNCRNKQPRITAMTGRNHNFFQQASPGSRPPSSPSTTIVSRP